MIISGCVLIDGVDTRNVSLRSLRNRVTVVPQDTSLFDNSVEYNIKYGLEYSSTDGNSNYSEERKKEDERVQLVLEKCNLVETINKLPNGIKTQVGERGALLSGKSWKTFHTKCRELNVCCDFNNKHHHLLQQS